MGRDGVNFSLVNLMRSLGVGWSGRWGDDVSDEELGAFDDFNEFGVLQHAAKHELEIEGRDHCVGAVDRLNPRVFAIAEGFDRMSGLEFLGFCGTEHIDLVAYLVHVVEERVWNTLVGLDGRAIPSVDGKKVLSHDCVVSDEFLDGTVEMGLDGLFKGHLDVVQFLTLWSQRFAAQ